MTSVVAICNMALSHIGTKSTIVSLDEASPEARLCRVHYDTTRDAALRMHPWNFATRRRTLSDLGSPPGDWTFRYGYPTDCLHARGLILVNGDPSPSFEVAISTDAAGNDIRVILSDEPSALLVYTRRVTDPAIYDAEFVSALSWLLAADLAMPLTGKRDKRADALQMAEIAVARAKARDAGEGKPDEDRDADWILARG